MLIDAQEDWVPIAQALPLLRRHFRTKSALLHHLRKRDTNGLAAAGAVRKSPLGMLLVNPDRVNRWALGEGTQAAA
jgi:hypothetical protein